MTSLTSFNATRRSLAAVTMIVLMAGCADLAEPGPSFHNVPVAPSGQPRGLAINGFNYTDLYIASFEVNHQGGGNIFVSTPTSGGGGTTCCVTWQPGTTLPKPIKVRWSRDRKRWCEKTVMLTAPVPANPTAIGVHFMPDGDVQLELSEGYPKPKLRLESFDASRRHASSNVIYDEQSASCKDDY